MMYEYPEVIDEALERNTEHTVRLVEVLHNLYDGPIIHACDDLGMKGRTLLSPAWLREHAIPQMQRVIAAIKAGGKYFAFHTCGNVDAVIPDLIAAGIDALDPIEETSGMSLARVKALYGDQIVIMGGTNANVMQLGTVEEVRQEVRRCLEEGARGGGFALHLGTTQVTPPENIMACFDEVKANAGWW